MTVLFNCPHSAMAAALGDSFSAAGHAVFHRNPLYFRDSAIEKCDLLFVGGRKRFRIIEAYRDKLPEIPIMCIDWGYFDRVNEHDQSRTGHWAISRDDINILPEGDFPPDRLKKTKLKFARQGGDPDGYALIIGQVPTDTAVRDLDFDAWVKEQASIYPRAVFRRHPKSDYQPDGVPALEGTLQEAFAGAALVVTYNSNAGWEALAAGLPVVCDSSAAYFPLSGRAVPSVQVRRQFFSRAAYGQWKTSEADEAMHFVLSHWRK